METLSEQGVRTVACAVRVTRSEVPPGASFSLSAEVTTPDETKLDGVKLSIVDGEGTSVAQLALIDFDGQVNRTADVQLRAPRSPGAHVWQLRFPEQTVAGIAYAEARVNVPIEVIAHPIRANVWGLPPAPIAGTNVRVHVGAKGADDVALGGCAFEVVDEEGTVVATGTLGSTIAPGTAGLYAAEVELPTPSEPGIARWTLRVPGFTEPVPHGGVRHEFSVRTAAEPDRTITVRAIDLATRSPIERADVVLHPYRGTAEVGGVATVRVADGTYNLFVTAPGYEVFRTQVEVTHDLEVDAELEAVVEPDPGENYV